MVWFYQGKEFTQDDVGEYKAFCYNITCLTTDKQYIGKKRFLRKTTRPPLKGAKRKRVSYDASDWGDYYGSSESLLAAVEKSGKENFKREILHLCMTHGESSYWEAYEQFNRHVLLYPDKYFNNWISCKIHRKHVYKAA